MSRRDDEEDARADRREGGPIDPKTLRAISVALVVAGGLLRVVAPRDSPLRIVGGVVAVLALLGLPVAQLLARRATGRSGGEADRASDATGFADDGAAVDPYRNARRASAAISGLFTALGFGLLAHDALYEEPLDLAWAPLVTGCVGLLATGIWSAASEAHPREPGRLIEGPPREDRTRGWIAFAVGALLLAQALIPIRYYVGDDIFDERFSWRMFSAVRVYACELGAFETRAGAEAQVPLMRTIHVAWVNTLRRNREAVMERYLTWRCEQEGVESARLLNRCRTPEGRQVPDVVRSIDCETNAIDRGPDDDGAVRVTIEGAEP